MKTIHVLPSGILMKLEDPNFAPRKINNKAAWLAALRSGQYKQTQKRLHTNEGFCCLGVLMDIEGCVWYTCDAPDIEGRKVYAANDSTNIYQGDNIKVLGHAGALPSRIELQLPSRTVNTYSLAQLNDNGLSFEDIAYIINIMFEDKDFPVVTSEDYSIDRVIKTI